MPKKRKQRSTAIAAAPPANVVNLADYRPKGGPLQPNRKPIIMLAVPSKDGQVNYSIALMFARAMASSHLPECPFQFITHIEVAKTPHDYARNCIVEAFLKTDADWLLMIDADQIVPENFWQLCTVDCDIVSGVTPVWVGNMDAEAMYRVNHYGVNAKGQCYNLPTPPLDLKDPYRVPICGTGCIAIRRRVFAPAPNGVGSTPFRFTYEDNRKVQAGEDINFSVDCQKAGFKIAVHPAVWFDHMKSLPLMAVDAWYRARRKVELEGREISNEQRLSIG